VPFAFSLSFKSSPMRRSTRRAISAASLWGRGRIELRMMIAIVVVLLLGCFGVALWLHGVNAGILDAPGERAEFRKAEQQRTERESRMTATERWAEDQPDAAPSASFREFLFDKYGDTAAAYDAWKAAGRKPDGFTALAQEMMDWRRSKG
jgi:hypothetical protein